MIYNLAVLVGALALTSTEASYANDTATQKYMFNQFIREYKKSYDSAELPKKFAAFQENLKLIEERNKAEKGSAIHGITRFSDLTQEEFKKSFLTASKNTHTSDFHKTVDSVKKTSASDSVDWTGIFTTPVKDQGYCGSCWAFSATEQLESDSMRVLGTSYILSAEQTNQCTEYRFGGGCGGGMTESAYTYFRTEGGLVQDEDYPYTASTYAGKTGDCEVNTREDVVAITGYTTLKGETNMANYMLSTGPLSVCVAAENWNTYRSGIMTNCPGGVDHCVQAVGVDTSSVGGYWKVRNSWGTSWGEDGYIRLSYGDNTCKITDDPTYVDPIKV